MNSSNTKIVKVTVDELEILQKLAKETFFETYSWELASDDLKAYLERAFAKEKLLKEIENPASEFYFAKQNENALGYLKVNFNTLEINERTEDSLEIERIYIPKVFQGKRIGTLLLNKSINLAKAKELSYIWLGVGEKNSKSVEFYERKGFIKNGRNPFFFGDEIHDNLRMILKI